MDYLRINPETYCLYKCKKEKCNYINCTVSLGYHIFHNGLFDDNLTIKEQSKKRTKYKG